MQMDTLKDEQQARDLLVWHDDIGTLGGCDLRFKINQLGCLELLDSDEESENQNNLNKTNTISSNLNRSSNDNNANTSTSSRLTNGVSNNNATDERSQQHLESATKPTPIRQISPGSSLLRDGPNMRRPKSSCRLRTGSFSLLKKVEHNQNSILLQKLVPKRRLMEIKTTNNVEKWTIEDVKKFVDSIPGCSGYGELFESQKICGKSLMYLDQRDLLDVINVKLGPAVKIYHAISLLK